MNLTTTIQPVGGFFIKSMSVNPSGMVSITYDAPGVAGTFAITTQQFEPTGCIIHIEQTTNATTTIEGEHRLPPGNYRIADIGGLPDKVYDLGSFQIPGNVTSATEKNHIHPFMECELTDSLYTIPGPGKWFIATKQEDVCVVLPVPQQGHEITINNWASMSGFGPQDAKQIMMCCSEPNGTMYPMFPIQPGKTRTFVGIKTIHNSNRWAIL